MRDRVDSKRPFRSAVKVNVNQRQLAHFAGSVYVLGKIERKELNEFLPVIDEAVAFMATEKRQNVSHYFALVMASDNRPSLAFMDPERIQTLVDLYGDTIPQAIVRCKFGPF